MATDICSDKCTSGRTKQQNCFTVRKLSSNIKTVRHDGQEIQVVMSRVTDTDLEKIINTIKGLGYKMFCVKQNDKVICTELTMMK